jgi:two-component system, NtrC family, response regulator HydG
LPPLREIREDLPVLAGHFLMKLRQRMTSTVAEIAPEVMEIFLAYDWPGNVRELENVMERALALCPGSTIKPEHLPEGLVKLQARSASERPERHLQDDHLALAAGNAEKEQLLEALRRTGGSRTEAAALLNIHRTTVYFRLKKHGINLADIGVRRKS